MAVYVQTVTCETYKGVYGQPETEIKVDTQVVTAEQGYYLRFISKTLPLTKKRRVSEPMVYAYLAGYSDAGSDIYITPSMICNGDDQTYHEYALDQILLNAPQVLYTNGATVRPFRNASSITFYTELSNNAPYLLYVIEDITPEARNLYPMSFIDETKPATFGWEFYAETPENGVPLIQKSAVLQWRSADGTVHEINISGESQSYTFASGTFPENESIQWRVQVTSDDDIASEWSAWQTVSTAESAGAVSNLYPADMLVNSEIINRISWRYVNEVGTEQSAYDIEMSTDGTLWTSLNSENTSNQYYDAPAGTFVAEKTWIRVRAYNSSGIASEWASVSFTVRSSPEKPSIVSVSTDVDKPLISWESTGQEVYEIAIGDAEGKIVYSRIIAGNEKRHKIALRLEDGEYIASLKVRNKYNMVSPVAQRVFAVSTVKPDKPSLYALQSDGTVVMTFTHTTDKAVLLRNDVAIANVSGLSSYVDHTAHGTCEYVLRALSDDSFCDSEPYEVTAGFGYALISTIDNPVDCLCLRFKAGSAPENSVAVGAESASLSFAGRQYPVTEFGEHKSLSKKLSYSVLTERELQKILSMMGHIVLWRDRNDKFYGSLADLSFERHRSYIDVSFSISRQEVSEEIDYE